MLHAIADALRDYVAVLEPEENTPEWWAGAPSVVQGPDGTFYLAARMREGKSPRGRRGYEVRILKSADGRSFEVVNRITREAARQIGFERPALAYDPQSGRFRLYGCANLGDTWGILRFDDADDPARFEPATARVILSPEHTRAQLPNLRGYKDPFVILLDGRWHMFVIGFDAVERAYHLVSADGESWQLASDRPVLGNAGWHDYYTRPACLVSLDGEYLLVYEGSDARWRDPAYNIATGLARSRDLESFEDLTPKEPLLRTTTPGAYHTWRYSHWLPVGRQVYVYFEAARPNNTNEVRLAVIERARLEALR